MIESSVFFSLKDLGQKNHVNLDQSKNLEPFFVHVGLISPPIHPLLLLTKKCHFLEEIFFEEIKLKNSFL
jgi:hypothetical protein